MSNEYLGALIAALSSGDRQQMGSVVIYSNCSGVANKLAQLLGANAFTVGSFVFFQGDPERQILKHEMAHVTQYNTTGMFFLPTYAVLEAGTRAISVTNPMELWADWMAGTDVY
ncbi:MAG: DUF4157 domain-containing protein [Chloroflexi bacterium]|nr:DUF4157 domain-containing protein [Chloroflexota bacterium]